MLAPLLFDSREIERISLGSSSTDPARQRTRCYPVVSDAPGSTLAFRDRSHDDRQARPTLSPLRRRVLHLRLRHHGRRRRGSSSWTTGSAAAGRPGRCSASLLGGLLLLPIARVYGSLVRRIPDAGAEIAYTEGVFPAAPLLRHRLDDGARLRDRLPVGGRGHRQPPRSHRPLARTRAAVRPGRQDHVRAAAGGRAGADRPHRVREPSRDPAERRCSRT